MAIQDRCSARLSIFRWAPFRLPKQGENMQRARARAPGASIRLMGSRGVTIQVHGGCSMEREGKAGGGRVSIGSSCVVCCCVCSCLAMDPHMYPICVRAKTFWLTPLVLHCYATLRATLLVVTNKNRKCKKKMTSLRTQVLRGTSRRILT
jgi:hypothetical protein